MLFTDLDGLCRRVTLAFYRESLGEEIDATYLISTSAMVAERTERIDQQSILYRYLQGQLLGAGYRFFPKHAVITASQDEERAQGNLEELRAKLMDEVPRAAAALQQYAQAEDRFRHATLAAALVDASVRFDPKDLQVPMANRDSVQAVRAEAAAQRDRAAEILDGVSVIVNQRLICALGLLACERIAAVTSADKTQSGNAQLTRCQSLITTWKALKDCWLGVHLLHHKSWMLPRLLDRLTGEQYDSGLITKIQQTAADIGKELQELRRRLSVVAYPFEHGGGPISIGVHVVPAFPDADDLGALHQAAQAALISMETLYLRLVSELVVIAEQVEGAIGLPSMPEPASLEAAPPPATEKS